MMIDNAAALYLVVTLAILLTVASSQQCPSGCTCTLNGSNDGTIVVCNGELDEYLVFHLVHPKIVHVVIRNYRNLESVDLSEHSITDLSSVEIGRGSIKHLDLSYNQITTASLQHFSSLDMLELLDLSNNGMTSFDTSNVNAMRNLIEINLEDNRLRNLILNPTVYTRVNFPYLTIILYRNPLECLCDFDNALTQFAPGETTCSTENGQTITLQNICDACTCPEFLNNSLPDSTNVSSVNNVVTTLVDDESSSGVLPKITSISPQMTATTNLNSSSMFKPSPTSSLTPSSTRVIPTTSMSPLVDTTSLQQDSKDSNDTIFVIIGGTITGVMATLILLLFTLMIMVCRLKKRFTSSGQNHDAKVTTVTAEPENYLSPIRMASFRLSQLTEQHYEEIDPISVRLGPVPPLPDVVEASTMGVPTIVPYHVTKIEDIDAPTEAEQKNQYLDLQA